MWKFLILLMARSTRIRKLASSCVFTTSSAAICEDASRKGGKFKLTPKGNKSWIVNPLSAIMESLSSNGRFKNPLLLIISRSEIEPVYSWLMNVTAPLGGNTNQTFQSCVIFVSTEKFSIQLQAAWHLIFNLSTANYDSSIFVLSLKDAGIVVSITFLLGQMFICPNLRNVKLTHVINILPTVDADISNNWPRWCSGSPCLSLHMTIKN